MMQEENQPTVWKMIYLARRNPALAAADFPQAWREHSALGRQCKSVGQRVKAVAQCSRQLQANALALSSDYDGVNLMVLAEREAGAAIWDDPETLAIMRPDEPRVFADYVRNFSVLCRQQVLYDSLAAGASAAALPQKEQVMLIGFLQRSDEWQGAPMSFEQCPPKWKSGGLNQASRIVCNTLDEKAPAGYGYRYIVEWWFDSVELALSAAHNLDVSAAAQSGEFGWGVHQFILTEVTHARP
ncbi:EthD domain-containing protein [Comamonas sp. Y33R10-2]|uniref:EthD domain-containing protein n=1 Tax=Comamonas sp. Y33R10-2 TaxID=2853257 RepID=UPI0021040B04|nr:EthD domain-containing protein [Comamonas sp. Y33R10-2]